MCGIYCAIFNTSDRSEKYIRENLELAKLLNHRGPDGFNFEILECGFKTIIMAHTRLHIIGESTPQPIKDKDEEIYLIINGEIFNWKELSKELNFECKQSDCEILIPLYKKYIRYNLDFKTFFDKLNGQFSFVLYDKLNNHIFVSRDHIGITPLYYGYINSNISSPNQTLDCVRSINFSSELKCLTKSLDVIEVFEPRQYLFNHIDTLNTSNSFIFHKYLDYYDNHISLDFQHLELIKENIKNKLEKSVTKQLEDIFVLNINYGVLLSGGLDSSLIASIISKQAKAKGQPKVKTFSIGVNKDSVDLIASRKVAEFLDTEHYEFYFTLDEGIAAIKDVIYYTETYDTTTVRASTAMYLLTKKIKEKFPSLKVLFSGELSDELLCYLYGSNAPNEHEFQQETIKLVSNVHLFDCLRANKTCMANSIEPRVPFTDPDFVQYILNIPAKFKTFGTLRKNNTGENIMEKQLLRDSFNVTSQNSYEYLPKEILFRRKEAFSDGISTHDGGENWIDYLIRYTDEKYTDFYFNVRKTHLFNNMPTTKEQLWYREIFNNLFNKNFKNSSELTVKFWKPNWCGNNVDPSARKHIQKAFKEKN